MFRLLASHRPSLQIWAQSEICWFWTFASKLSYNHDKLHVVLSRRFRRDFTVLKSDHLFGEMSVYNSDLGPLLPTTLFYIVFDCALFNYFQLCFISVISIPRYFQYVLFTVFSAAMTNIDVIVVRVYMGRACKGNPFMKIHLLIWLCCVSDEVSVRSIWKNTFIYFVHLSSNKLSSGPAI